MRLRYDIVDVFTDRPFAGNQLAVVHGTEGLATEQLQAVAQEFRFSETTFPSRGRGSSYDVRIFTPERELPFAGHPTLGTAWVLRSQGSLDADEVTQHCPAGEVGVRFDGHRVELSAQPRELVGPVPPDLAADLLVELRLTADDLDGEAWIAGAGLSFVHVPVRPDAVARAVPSGASFEPYADRLSALGSLAEPVDAVNLHAVVGSSPRVDVHSRVFVPGVGVPEDPATGSAAAGLGIALVARGVLPDGGEYVVTQGVEMGRPSRLFGRVEAQDGRAVRCHVGGLVQPVATGEIAVP
jgi:trans-2,3-dihydro-3-hydroxyanthranilate isomerase